MSDTNKKIKYCFDSSAFMNGWSRHYKPKTFECLWNHIGNMIERGLIIIPEEVSKEIHAGKDDLVPWFKKYKSYITSIDQEQINNVSSIINKYPLMSEYKSSKIYSADAFVVALAKIHKYTVVTYENSDGNKAKPKIPVLCKEHCVDCCDLATFFEKEGMTFDIKH